jgi:hypothetical protein
MPKNFEKINDSFLCEICGHKNPPAEKTCRNHCRKCLSSKHVDNLPGDRACDCQGILNPIGLGYVGGEARQVVFRCKKCGKLGRNKIASDDDKEALLKLAGKPVPGF